MRRLGVAAADARSVRRTHNHRGTVESIDHIELHDSVVQIRSEADELVLELRPAYVHHWIRVAGSWYGRGGTQVASIRLTEGRVVPNQPLLPTEIADGWIRIGEESYANLVPVPLSRVGAVNVHLELANEPIDLFGSAIVVELAGAFEDIEELPADWAPVRDAV
jgi:hypothetical protein